MLPTSQGIIPTRSPIQTQTTTASSSQGSILISSTSTVSFQTPIPANLTPPIERITVVGILCSLTVLFLVASVLITILYCISYTLKHRKKKRYSQFIREHESATTPSDRDTEQDSDNAKYNPVYLTESFLENEAHQQSQLQNTLICLKAGIEVEATQDYFEPGSTKENPMFVKGERITIRQVEGDPEGAVMVWLRGELDGREVCFPSYVIRLMDKLEDTFDTLSNPTRRESQWDQFLAQDSVLTADSAPAELESIFHEVDANFDTRHLNAPPLKLSRGPKRYSASDVSYEPKVKRPTRRPPRPPSALETPLEPKQKQPKVPPKMNRPRLSFREKGSKETNELVFMPPLSSSTPRKVAPKTGPKPKGIRALIPLRKKGARPDTPDAKSHKPRIAPRGYSWTPDSPDQILPLTTEPPPSRPDPPFTPSTLSLILNSAPTQDIPDKPPPPKIYETLEELKSVIASRAKSDEKT